MSLALRTSFIPFWKIVKEKLRFFAEMEKFPMKGKEFGEWLDDHGIDVDGAAAYFGVSSGTIYKWRSTPGIPDRKIDWVTMKMTAYKASGALAPSQTSLALSITDQQLQAFIDASVRHKMRLTEWAIHALDEAASESLEAPSAPSPSPPSVFAVVDDRSDDEGQQTGHENDQRDQRIIRKKQASSDKKGNRKSKNQQASHPALSPNSRHGSTLRKNVTKIRVVAGVK